MVATGPEVAGTGVTMAMRQITTSTGEKFQTDRLSVIPKTWPGVTAFTSRGHGKTTSYRVVGGVVVRMKPQNNGAIYTT